MAGHGTAISTSDAQGDTDIYVISNGGDDNFSESTYGSALNLSGGTIPAGSTVVIEWDAGQEAIVINGLGSGASGSVSFDGGSFTVSDPGDSGLEGVVNISTQYGESAGFGGQSEVIACNIDGMAAIYPDQQSE